MTKSRIYFLGNPWPEGHPIKTFSWSANVEGGKLIFGFDLVTKRYISERPIDEDEDDNDESDDDDNTDVSQSNWEAPVLWKNFHRCSLYGTFSEGSGTLLGLSRKASLDALDGLEVVVDSQPQGDIDDNAFQIYLLGHDAVAEHRIKFSRIVGTKRFDIDWSGKIALAYSGDFAYRFAFKAELRNIRAPLWGK